MREREEGKENGRKLTLPVSLFVAHRQTLNTDTTDEEAWSCRTLVHLIAMGLNKQQSTGTTSSFVAAVASSSGAPESSTNLEKIATCSLAMIQVAYCGSSNLTFEGQRLLEKDIVLRLFPILIHSLRRENLMMQQTKRGNLISALAVVSFIRHMFTAEWGFDPEQVIEKNRVFAEFTIKAVDLMEKQTIEIESILRSLGNISGEMEEAVAERSALRRLLNSLDLCIKEVRDASGELTNEAFNSEAADLVLESLASSNRDGAVGGGVGGDFGDGLKGDTPLKRVENAFLDALRHSADRSIKTLRGGRVNSVGGRSRADGTRVGSHVESKTQKRRRVVDLVKNAAAAIKRMNTLKELSSENSVRTFGFGYMKTFLKDGKTEDLKPAYTAMYGLAVESVLLRSAALRRAPNPGSYQARQYKHNASSLALLPSPVEAYRDWSLVEVFTQELRPTPNVPRDQWQRMFPITANLIQWVGVQGKVCFACAGRGDEKQQRVREDVAKYLPPLTYGTTHTTIRPSTPTLS